MSNMSSTGVTKTGTIFLLWRGVHFPSMLPMSRLPKLSHKAQLPPAVMKKTVSSCMLPLHSGLQDTLTVSTMSSPPQTEVSYSWTDTLGSGEKDLLLAEREQDIARLQDALRREQENSKRLQERCNRQAWELKCKEKQNSRLKEKLSQLYDKTREHKASIDLLNVLPRPFGKKPPARGVKTEARREEQVLRLMLERVEAELREAVTLGHSVTALLRSLRVDMDRTLQDSVMAVEEVFDCEVLAQTEALLGEHVTGGVVQAWSRVQKKLQQLTSQGLSSSTVGTDQEKLLAQLEAELEQNKQLVRMQQQLLEDSVHSLLPPALADSYYLEEWERLQLKWAEFEDQRRSFQRERQAFTDAAIRLGYERCQFEQQKASLLRQQFLCHSPCIQQRRESNTMNVSRSDHMTYSSRFPVTASSPESGIAPGSGQTPVGTPSTPELFSAMSLSPGPSHCSSPAGHQASHLLHIAGREASTEF